MRKLLIGFLVMLPCFFIPTISGKFIGGDFWPPLFMFWGGMLYVWITREVK
jgi:hypothetical protein